MTHTRRTSLLILLALAFGGSLTPAQAQARRVSFLINIAAEPSIGGTAIGAATGTANGATISIPETSWSKTHSDRSPLFEGGVAVAAGQTLDIVALVNYGHAGAKGTQVGQLGGLPVTAALDDYTYWGVEGGAHVRRASGLGPYVRITAGFRRVSAIDARLSTTTLTSTAAVYAASNVPTFAFGGGMVWGDQSFALGFEVAVRYAGAPATVSSLMLPTVPGTTLTPASGAGSRWSLPVGVVLRF